MKRNQKNQYEAVRSYSEKIEKVKRNQEQIFDMLSEMSGQIKQIASTATTDKVSINHLFPIEDDAQIMELLDKTDPNYEKKMDLFESMLYTHFNPIDHPDLTNRTFADSLLSTIFDRKYLVKHRYPSITYVTFIYL